MFSRAYVSNGKALNKYLENKFVKINSPKGFQSAHTQQDKAYVEFWHNQLNKTPQTGALDLLKKCFPQLHFPIEEGISKSIAYRNSTLKGKSAPSNGNQGLSLINPNGIQLKSYQSLTGPVMVVIIPEAGDFTTLVRALVYKNEPYGLPGSMGAVYIKGINNWHRLRLIQQEWVDRNPFGDWLKKFRQDILPNTALYTDSLVLLSTKPYSDVPYHLTGYSEKEWKAISTTIRLEHECTHLFTQRRFGHMANNAHDELIADYIGTSKALGAFDPHLMRLFLGLESYPLYRKGGRLENYLGEPSLCQADFEILRGIVHRAILNLTEFDKVLGRIKSETDQTARIICLCQTGLVELGAENAYSLLLERYNELLRSNLISQI